MAQNNHFNFFQISKIFLNATEMRRCDILVLDVPYVTVKGRTRGLDLGFSWSYVLWTEALFDHLN